jgi:hypothetical protein
MITLTHIEFDLLIILTVAGAAWIGYVIGKVRPKYPKQ